MKGRYRVELLLFGTAAVLLGITFWRIAGPDATRRALYDANAAPAPGRAATLVFDPEEVRGLRLSNRHGTHAFRRLAEPSGNRWIADEGGFDPSDAAMDTLLAATKDLVEAVGDPPMPKASDRSPSGTGLELTLAGGSVLSVRLLDGAAAGGPVWAEISGRSRPILLPAPWRGRLGASKDALLERRLIPCALSEVTEARWIEDDRMFAARSGYPVQALLKLRAVEVVDPAPGHADLDEPIARIEVDRSEGPPIHLLVGGRAAGGGAWMQVAGRREGLLVREPALDRVRAAFLRQVR